ncbi:MULTISPECIES: thioredoxin family protein [Pseudomonas]|uniref:Thioredoxin n=1 Tax=Pseudomonas moraviensis TaxID=321662 RepID=A0A2A2PRB5_9PSED|nr:MULTISPECIES: thioredoxin family protein [Pseudomonas]MBA5979722.1 thioredoxin family protein [Pseudomonas sp. MD195_PC81_125]PAW51885.1 thioredoxin [Pseudomonas moraviensis]PAW57990.1 thioredoxin [Pseudomonas moraviensis]QXE10991.1 thioredoxin family protein [Pseudomonas sp. AN-B15]
MSTDSLCRPFDIVSPSIVVESELTDFDADQRLLAMSGVSLVIFTSVGCSSCRYAREVLPGFALAVDRLCWIDAGNNGGLVERYQVFHLPALFVVRDGEFFGALHTRLTAAALNAAVAQALGRIAEELP